MAKLAVKSQSTNATAMLVTSQGTYALRVAGQTKATAYYNLCNNITSDDERENTIKDDYEFVVKIANRLCAPQCTTEQYQGFLNIGLAYLLSEAVMESGLLLFQANIDADGNITGWAQITHNN